MDDKVWETIQDLINRADSQRDRITHISQRLDIVIERLDKLEGGE